METYDLVVIGGGSAGLTACQFAAAAGARVLLVERSRAGGDCTWTGCVPSKALIEAARVAHRMRHAERYGLPAAIPTVDLGRVMDGVKSAVERVYALETPDRLMERGIETVIADAQFLDPQTLQAGERRIAGKRFLICTGAEPALPDVPGLADARPLTYLDVWDLRRLPASLAVVGGGPIGCELAQAFARLGSSVTLIEGTEQLLSIAHPEVGRLLQEQFEEEAIRVLTGSTIARVERTRWGTSIDLGDETVEADSVLVVTGRRPHLEGLALERAGVRATDGGIEVDDQLRTSQAGIYAAGDVTGGFQFTHYAGWQGFQAARNALLPGSARGVRDHVLWAVFTDPEIAHAGRASAESEVLEVHRWPLERLDRALTSADRRGFLEVRTHGGIVVGATAVGTSASELINELAVAIERRLTLTDLASVIHAYPTYAFGIQQLAAQAAVKKALGGITGRVIRTLVR